MGSVLVALLLIIILVLIVLVVPMVRRKTLARVDQPLGRLRAKTGFDSPKATVAAVLRQVKAQAIVMLSNVWLPNSIVVYMNEAEFERLGPAAKQLADEIEHTIREQALPNKRTREPSHYFFPSSVRVRIIPDAEVPAGTYSIEAWIEEDTILQRKEVARTQPMDITPTLTTLLLRVRLGEDRRAYPLPRGRSTIGRSANATIRINETGVSREHAALTINSDSDITFEDLGSTNGTFVGTARLSGPFRLEQNQRFRLGEEAQAYVVANRPGDEATKKA